MRRDIKIEPTPGTTKIEPRSHATLLLPIYNLTISQASRNFPSVLHRVWVIIKRVSYPYNVFIFLHTYSNGNNAGCVEGNMKYVTQIWRT